MKLVYPSLILLSCALLVSIPSFSQINDCGNNAGFEAGTAAGWVCTHGSYGTGPCPTATCPAFNLLLNNTGVLNPGGVNAALTSANDRHVVVTGAGMDANSNNTVSVVAPGGGNYSFRLGNANAGGTTDGYAQAEGARLTFPVTAQNAGFTYRYAAFIEDPGHRPEEQPRFEITVTDAQGNQIPCGYYKVVAGTSAGCPGTNSFQIGAGAWVYSNWTDVGLDLTSYIGQTVSIEFRTADCYPGNGNKACLHNGPGSHSAYVYIDAYCQPLSISAPFVCTSAASIQICAPPGYLNYSWPAGQGGISGSPTTQCVTVNNPVIGTVYHVNMTSVTGCPVSTTVTLQGTNASTSDTTVCAGAGNVPLSVTTSTGGSYTYAWTGPNGFTSNIQSPVIAIPSSTTTYSVNVTSNAGCSVAKTMTVNVIPKPAMTVSQNASACSGTSVSLSSSGGTTYSWSPATGLSNPGIANPVANPGQTTTYSVTITNASGCKNTGFTTVTINPPPTVTVSPASSMCIGSNTSLTSSGGSVYSWSPSTGLSNSGISNPVANPTATTTYSVFVTDGNGCKNSASVTLTVNPLPVVSVSPSSAVCSGFSTQLSAAGGAAYSWSPSTGLNNPNISNPSAGPGSTTTYTVTVTNANGCKNNASTTITINPLPAVGVSPSVAFCKGGSTQLSSSGGISYVWSPATGLSNPNISNPTSSPNSNINYTVTVTGTNGCTNSASTTVTVHSLPNINMNPTPGASICKGSNILLNASGGVTYSWSPTIGLNNPNIANPVASPTIATSYSVFVTDANGCENNATTNIAVSPFATVNVSPNAAICTGSSVQITSSTTGSATYTWSPATGLSNPGVSNPVASPTSTTNYTVSVTNSNGCTGTSVTTITVNPLPVAGASASPTVCRGTSAQLSASGGVLYSWSPSTGLLSTTGSTVTVNVSTSTSYLVTVTDGNNCTSNASVMVNVNALPNITASPNASICYGANTQLTASGGASFTWTPATGLSNPNSSTPVATPTATTTYSVNATDANGCSGNATVTIGVNHPPVVNVSPNSSVCSGASTQLSASGGITYAWSPSSSLNNPNIANPVASPGNSTTYTVNVTDGNGCKGNGIVAVVVNPGLVITISPDQSFCNGSSAQLSSSGGTIYSWMPASGLSDPTISNPVASPNATTTYSLIVSDASSCTGTATVKVTVNPAPNISTNPDVAICNGSGTQLTASGGTVYTWSPSTGLSDPTISNPIASPSITTIYSLNILDANGCGNSASVKVTVNPFISVNVSPAVAICNGSITQLISGGGTNYTWSPVSGLNDPNISNPIASPSITTTYSVHVTDASGCSGNSAVIVSVYQAPPVNINPDVAICGGSSVQLTASGGTTYSWTPASGLSDPAISNPVATPSVTTVYILTITDINSCSNSASVTVSIPGSPNPNISSTDVSCKGSNDGTASTTPSGGVPNYSYLWNTSATGSSINGLSPGTYSVTVTDAIGCTSVSSVVINEPPPIALNFPRRYYICDEGAGVSLIASGGTTYLWTPGADLSDSTIADPYAAPLITTTFTVTVSNGACFDTAHVTVLLVSAPAPPPVTQSGDTLFVPIGFTNYQWYYEGIPIPGATIHNYVAMQTGHYSVYLIDNNGCRVITSSTYIITSINNPSVNAVEGILVYPNPAGEELWVTGYGMWLNGGAVDIELYNVLGENVYRSEFSAQNSQLQAKLDISLLARGIYVIRITSTDKTWIERVVKD